MIEEENGVVNAYTIGLYSAHKDDDKKTNSLTLLLYVIKAQWYINETRVCYGVQWEEHWIRWILWTAKQI